MEFLFFLILLLLIIFILILYKKKDNSRLGSNNNKNNDVLAINNDEYMNKVQGDNELSIAFESVSQLTDNELSHLVEIKNTDIIGRIDNAIPGTVQAVVNSRVASVYNDVASSRGQLYQVIIPKGVELDRSRAIEGTVRGSYRGANGKIAGNANWKAVDDKAAQNLVKMSNINAIMNVSSMVVGQYYMAQISTKIDELSDEIKDILDFLDTEYKGKVLALIADVQRSAKFQLEIVENTELRNRELMHIKNLELNISELLGQANLNLQEISKLSNLKYDGYEKNVIKAEKWNQYRYILTKLLSQLADLTFTLNLGAISKEISDSLVDVYNNQSESTLKMLKEWNEQYCEKYGIDVEESKRKNHGVLSLIAPFKYKNISERTSDYIANQTKDMKSIEETESNLYKEDVRLIAKDGKLYYLPSEKDM